MTYCLPVYSATGTFAVSFLHLQERVEVVVVLAQQLDCRLAVFVAQMLVLCDVALVVDVKDSDVEAEHLCGAADHEINDLVIPEAVLADHRDRLHELLPLVFLRVALCGEERRQFVHARRQMSGELLAQAADGRLLPFALQANPKRREEAVAAGGDLD